MTDNKGVQSTKSMMAHGGHVHLSATTSKCQ